ncbi:poly(A)-specific ribonuclease PARN-like isoform X2 [Homarus americanus]|uniref:poly(A)-specific ribonuclease PARN-like isoform X2 n=1 Tax=Homarus americanus TaxID=6706 RepID=UPI001C4794D0|nr:poly(A)-specific ribonuclease PARN-like isoform X2 [Homarus americanus]
MEVTKDNFKEVLPSVLSAIENADFVAVDAEFTGLRHHGTSKYCELDTPEERYAKSRAAAQSFGMIQFGVTTFRYVKEKFAYSHATYCFYLLGKAGDILYYDNNSLKFLADNGFDFNKLFKSGLPYLSLAQEAEKRAEYKTQSLEPQMPSPIKVAEENARKFLKETEAKMDAFMVDESQDVLLLPGSNISSFFRKILYNNIAALYQNILVRCVTTDSERNIEIRKFESSASRIKFLEEEREQRLDEKMGFTHVIHKILETGTPIVGHNLILDLFHMIDKMVQPLPEQHEQFKNLVKCNIPTIYDTKLIAKDPPFCVDIPITSLGILYSDLCTKYSPPDFNVEDGYESYNIEDNSKAHDAGYDAFMTGVCFVTMVKKLDGIHWKNKSVIKSKHLAPYANRVNNMNSYDIPFLNLVGADVQVNRSRIFCVECPSSWTAVHVHSLFHMIKPMKLVWVNSTFLYVIPLDDIDNKACKQHLKTLHANCPPLVRIRLYGDTGSSKRKSVSDEVPPGVETCASRVQEFKRLKSIGQEIGN